MPKSKTSQLKEYEAKRSFEKTPEPEPEVESGRKGPLLFVIQKHSATRLHYDLRLELDGVLKSWAVPKGLSYVTGDKHMAVEVEDHPFDYASFEGIIPAGQYGAGQVIVWDTGTYWCDEYEKHPCDNREQAEDDIRKGLRDGKLSFFLRGTKLKGSWALVRMKGKESKDWLILKHKDRYSDWKPKVLEEDQSVISGLTIADLERDPKNPPRIKAEDLIPARKFEAFPKALRPMNATLADHPFDDPDWAFEPKLDGVRVLAFIKGSYVEMISRNGLDLSSQFPALCAQLQEQYTRGMVIDGEIVAFQDGKPSFNAMLNRLHLKDRNMLLQMDADIPCALYVFDLLHFEGADLKGRQFRDRRRYLEQALLPTDLVQLISQVPEEGETLYTAVIRTGMERIVAKKLDSIYEQGKRSKCWLKIKGTQSSEFVVGGYSQGEGSRFEHFGSLLVGYYDKKGDLVYAGHVGSGFNDENLPLVKQRLEELKSTKMPFKEKPAVDGPTFWVKPEMVVEAKFNQLTPAKIMRGPVFLRVREDIDPKDVSEPKPPVHVDAEVEDMPKKDGKPKRATKEETVIEAVIDQLDNKDENVKLQVGEHTVAVTSLNKALWPANPDMKLEAFTKRDFLIYLTQVSPYMIPHLEDRPLTMIRYPEGIHGEKFFQKHWEQKKPDFVESVELYSESNKENQNYLLVNNLPTLLWLGQLGTLEFHVWGSRCSGDPDAKGLGMKFTDSAKNIESSVLNYPDMIKFDLDPYLYSGKEKEGDEPELHKEGFEMAKTVAFWLKDLLDGLKINTFVKTTSKTGLHIFVPIVRNLDYDAVKDIAEAFCRTLEREHPKEITTEWSIPKRTGKVFMDFNMNVRSKTLTAPYSSRATPTQAVSVPITWEELPKIYPTDFTMGNVPARLKKKGDVWASINDAKKDLTKILG